MKLSMIEKNYKRRSAASSKSLRGFIRYSVLNNEVFLRVTNDTGQVKKNLLGPAGIRTRDLRFTSPIYSVLVQK